MRINVVYGLNAGRNGEGNGLRPLADKLDAEIYEWSDTLPACDVMIGHSYGGAAAIDAIRKGLSCKHLFLIDAVPRWAYGQWQWSEWSELPSSLLSVKCFYRGFPILPPWSAKLKIETSSRQNVYVPNVNHLSIAADTSVHNAITQDISRL